MRRFVLLFLALFLLTAASASAATRYVSPGGSGTACTQAAPCSLSTGHAQAVAGDTVAFMDGNYGSISLTKGGTASARLKFVAVNRFGARFTSINTIGAYVDIGPGLNVSNPGITCGSNISPIGSGGADNYVGAHDVLVTGNYIHDVGTNASGWATSGCRDGGGIYVSSPSWTLTNNRIENVISDCITSWHSPSNMKAINNTVVNCGGGGVNLGGQSGGGYGANNVIVNAYLGGLYSNSSNTWVNNLVQGKRSAGVSGDTGTIVADPMFVSATDRHLRSGSPGIDSGTSNQAPSVDIEGALRPQGAGVDRGAYESGGSPPPPPPAPDTTPPAGPTNLHETTPAACTTACEMPMAWTAATDASGISGYDDYNDGVLVGHVSGTTTSASWGGDGYGQCETHTIGLRAIDNAGNTGPMVTATAKTYCPNPPPPPPDPNPDTSFTSEQASGTSDGAYYAFKSTQPNSTFMCAYDSPNYGLCPGNGLGPVWFPNQSVGTHTFKVYAVNAAGQADPTPAVSTWTKTA